MTVATTVLLVRHASHGLLGRTLAGRMAGVLLSEAGRDEARRLGARFGGRTADVLFSSPLERARETAGPIAAVIGLPVTTSEALNEIDCGEWTGASFDTLSADERWHGWNHKRDGGQPPGGEAMRAVQARAVAELERWRQAYPDGRVIAVTHADVIKALLCHVLGITLDGIHRFEVDPASVSTVIAWEGGAKIAALNERLDG